MSHLESHTQGPGRENSRIASTTLTSKIKTINPEEPLGKPKTFSIEFESTSKTRKIQKTSGSMDSDQTSPKLMRMRQEKMEKDGYKGLRPQKSDGYTLGSLNTRSPKTPSLYNHDTSKLYTGNSRYNMNRQTKSNDLPEFCISSRQKDGNSASKKEVIKGKSLAKYIEFDLTARDRDSSTSSSEPDTLIIPVTTPIKTKFEKIREYLSTEKKKQQDIEMKKEKAINDIIED